MRSYQGCCFWIHLYGYVTVLCTFFSPYCWIASFNDFYLYGFTKTEILGAVLIGFDHVWEVVLNNSYGFILLLDTNPSKSLAERSNWLLASTWNRDAVLFDLTTLSQKLLVPLNSDVIATSCTMIQAHGCDYALFGMGDGFVLLYTINFEKGIAYFILFYVCIVYWPYLTTYLVHKFYFKFFFFFNYCLCYNYCLVWNFVIRSSGLKSERCDFIKLVERF